MLQPTLHSICNSSAAGQTLLVVTAEDLREFALDVARKVMQQNEPQYFSRKELLQYLGVCSRTLWGYEDAGIITAKEVGISGHTLALCTPHCQQPCQGVGREEHLCGTAARLATPSHRTPARRGASAHRQGGGVPAAGRRTAQRPIHGPVP